LNQQRFWKKIAVGLLRREPGCRPLARTLDVLVIDDPLAVAGRDVVAARVVRNFDDFPEEFPEELSILGSFATRNWRDQTDDPIKVARQAGSLVDVAASLMRMWR
jgi:hypothetical protein